MLLALLGVAASVIGSAFAFLFLRWRPSKAGEQTPLRVLGCFDVQADDDDCSEDLWQRQRNPKASVGALKHSLRFARYSREHDIDVEREEEKLAAYRRLRKCDRDGFLRLLSRKPDEYKAYDSINLTRWVAVVEYLFLISGVYLIKNNMPYQFSCWSMLLLVTNCCCRSTLLTLGSKARGYYVCDEHNRLAERVRIFSQIVLELIFVYSTYGMGAAFSIALKLRTKKRQSLMEFCAGVWVITEHKQDAEIR